MFEKLPATLYALALRLYPAEFRRTYGEDALLLIRNRARDEKGFFACTRLWLDLLADLAISLPREYSRPRATPIVATQVPHGGLSFQLLIERPLNPALLCLGGALSVFLFSGCITSVAHSREFPAIFRTSLWTRAFPQSGPVRYPTVAEPPTGTQLLSVDRDARPEILDWGGSGEAILLIAGAGNSAHVFDRLAGKLVPRYHVYGLTLGSSRSFARLGDEVSQVRHSLRMDRPLVAGCELSDEELDSVSSRFPQTISGLIDLDLVRAGRPQARAIRLESDERALREMNQFLTELH